MVTNAVTSVQPLLNPKLGEITSEKTPRIVGARPQMKIEGQKEPTLPPFQPSIPTLPLPPDLETPCVQPPSKKRKRLEPSELDQIIGRVKLDRPFTASPIASMIHIVDNAHVTQRKMLDISTADLLKRAAEREGINTEYYENIRESSEAAKSAESWAMLHTTASLIGGAAVGIMGWFSGNPFAMCSGGLTMLSGITSYFSSEMQRKDANPAYIGALGVAASGLALGGGYYGFQTLSKELPSLIYTTLTGTMRLTQGISAYKRETNHAILTKLQGEQSRLEKLGTENSDAAHKIIGGIGRKDLVNLVNQTSSGISRMSNAMKKVINKV